jgi:putative Ca2+/H+ antiporter (TMEM165/GDT1 family)
MFASLVMATQGPPLAVWIGATAAFAVRVVIAITVGVLFNHILPHRAVEVAVALTFFAGAVSRSGAGTTRSRRTASS